MSALNDIMSRLYDILEQKVGTPVGGYSSFTVNGGNPVSLKASRYFPMTLPINHLPLATTIFLDANTVTTRYGHDADELVISATQQFQIQIYFMPFKSGANGTSESQAMAETLIPLIIECFTARTRLQLDSDSDKLDCLTQDVIFNGFSGLEEDRDASLVRFTLTITYEDIITRI